MEMKGSRVVPTDVDTTWRALNDPEVLRACIPGLRIDRPRLGQRVSASR